jgi:branched-chain amino acid transport system substrate-binding protein
MHKTYVIVLCGIVLLAAGCGRAKSGSHEIMPVKIGAVLPLTGWGAYWAEGEKKGVALAVEDIKQSGKDMEVVVEDGRTDATASASAAEKLLSIDRVDGIFVEFTGPSSSVSPIALRHNKVVLYDALTRKPLDENQYAFKMYYDAEKQCRQVTRYLLEQGHRRFGGVFLNLDFAPECKKGMDAALQGTPGSSAVYEEVDVQTTDFRTVLSKLQQEKVDAVVTMMYEDNAIAFFKQRAEMGLTFVVATGTGRADNFTDKVIASAPPQSLEGTITYGHGVRDWFVQKLRARYPEVTDNDLLSAGYGYDEVHYLYIAISECGSDKSPECISDKLKNNHTYESALQTSGFGPDRVLVLEPTYYIFTNGKLEPVQIPQ